MNKLIVATIVFFTAMVSVQVQSQAQDWTKIVGTDAAKSIYTLYTIEVGDSVCQVVVRGEPDNTITLTPLRRGHTETGDPEYMAAVRTYRVRIAPNGDVLQAHRRAFADKCGTVIKTLPPELRVRITPYITLKPFSKA